MPVVVRRWIFAAFALALSSGIARADRIDGDWCSPAGASMTIEGSRVVTPRGGIVEGRYNRHHFDYVVPEGDDNAGARVDADQIDEEHIRVTVTVTGPAQASPGPPEIWKRCKVISQGRMKKTTA